MNRKGNNMAELIARICLGAELKGIVEDFRKLQTYKLDNSGELFVSLNDAVKVLEKNLTVNSDGEENERR